MVITNATTTTEQDLIGFPARRVSSAGRTETENMSPTTTIVEDLKSELKRTLGPDLDRVNQILRQRLKSSSELVTDVTEHVSRFQGKQIRPILLLLFERSVLGHATCNGHTLGAAIEMIHTATLVHDDVIDEAATRRHVATVHRRWNMETSVLFGDYLFSRSFHLAASTGDAEACRLIGLATDRTCEGELNQSSARSTQTVSEIDYFRIIRDKTGQLFGLSCLLGARSGGASRRQVAAARRFGIRLGCAFQIADDLLDLTSDQSVTGKDSGNDLENNRLTLPLIRALRLANAAERKILGQAISVDGSADSLRQLDCFRQGIQSASDTARDLVARAIHDLRAFSDSRERLLLESIAQFAVSRET